MPTGSSSATYQSDVPCRVLVVLAAGNLNPDRAGGDELYDFFRRAAEWHRLLRPRQTFSVKARVHSCTDVPSAMLVQVGAAHVHKVALEAFDTLTQCSDELKKHRGAAHVLN